MRLFESAFGLASGPGEGPHFMAEELAFEQVPRQGAAVDRHERLVAAAAGLVDNPGQEFLTRARFSVNEHVGVVFGHLLDGAHDVFHVLGDHDVFLEQVGLDLVVQDDGSLRRHYRSFPFSGPGGSGALVMRGRAVLVPGGML